MHGLGREVVISRGPGGLEREIEAAGIGNEIPHICAGEHRGATIECQTFRNLLGVNPRPKLAQSRRQALQIIPALCGGDVGVVCRARKALQPGGQRADEHELHVVLRECAEDPLGIEWGNGPAVRHGGHGRRTRSGS